LDTKANLMENKKSYAFISYNHRDVKMAKWLHKKLESYKLPSEIHNEFEDSKYLRPVFRDQEDLNTGVLSDELRKHLDNSQYLVVICSPHSAKSEWVSTEVRTFIEWGRLKFIIPFIIDGTPNSQNENECFPLSLREYVSAHPDQELLGINISEIGRDKAFVRVVSRMLGVSFDELWKRHERERRRRIITWSTAILFLAGILYFFAVPVSLKILIIDENHHLPMPTDAILIVGNAEYSLSNLDTTIVVNAIPGYYRGRNMHITFSSTYYIAFSDNIKLGMAVENAYILNAKRDSSFAYYAGYVYDEKKLPVAKASVDVDDLSTYTDSVGHFQIEIPVDRQAETKSIIIHKPGMKTIYREDECPSKELKYIMHIYNDKEL